MHVPNGTTDYLQGLHSEIWKDIDIQNISTGSAIHGKGRE